jgi:hypothetical protein
LFSTTTLTTAGDKSLSPDMFIVESTSESPMFAFLVVLGFSNGAGFVEPGSATPKSDANYYFCYYDYFDNKI